MITTEEAVKVIWHTAKQLKPSTNEQIIKLVCDTSEEVQSFINAMNYPHIRNLLQEKNAVIELAVKSASQQYQTTVERLALAAAAIELASLTNYGSIHWLQRLLTFGFNTEQQPERAELKQEMMNVYPVDLLAEDELFEIFHNRAEAYEQQHIERVNSIEKSYDASELEEAVQATRSLVNTEPVIVTIPSYTAFLTVGLIQLAFRHPTMKEGGAFAADAKYFAQTLIDEIGKRSPEAKTYLESGWHQEFDKSIN